MKSIAKLAPGTDKVTEGSLYPHQIDGVAFLLSEKRAILADDMGLGKTRQAIVAMEVGSSEVCPECGYSLDADGPCQACWGTLWNG